MLLHDSRREARFRDGDLVLLADQDRSLWDAEQIAEGRAVLDRALALGGRGPVRRAGGDRVAARRRAARLAPHRRALRRARPPHRLAGRRAEPGRRGGRGRGPRGRAAHRRSARPRRLPLPALDAGRAAAPPRPDRRGPRRLPAGAGAGPRRRRAAAPAADRGARRSTHDVAPGCRLRPEQQSAADRPR